MDRREFLDTLVKTAIAIPFTLSLSGSKGVELQTRIQMIFNDLFNFTQKEMGELKELSSNIVLKKEDFNKAISQIEIQVKNFLASREKIKGEKKLEEPDRIVKATNYSQKENVEVKAFVNLLFQNNTLKNPNLIICEKFSMKHPTEEERFFEATYILDHIFIIEHVQILGKDYIFLPFFNELGHHFFEHEFKKKSIYNNVYINETFSDYFSLTYSYYKYHKDGDINFFMEEVNKLLKTKNEGWILTSALLKGILERLNLYNGKDKVKDFKNLESVVLAIYRLFLDKVIEDSKNV